MTQHPDTAALLQAIDAMLDARRKEYEASTQGTAVTWYAGWSGANHTGVTGPTCPPGPPMPWCPKCGQDVSYFAGDTCEEYRDAGHWPFTIISYEQPYEAEDDQGNTLTEYNGATLCVIPAPDTEERDPQPIATHIANSHNREPALLAYYQQTRDTWAGMLLTAGEIRAIEVQRDGLGSRWQSENMQRHTLAIAELQRLRAHLAGEGC